MMVDRDAIRGRALARRILARLPAEPKARVAAALAGGCCPHEAMMEAEPVHWPGITVAYYYGRVSPEGFRRCLRRSWLDRWCFLVRIAKAEGDCLLPMFRYGAFPLPPDLPDDVVVWRGMRGATVDQVDEGLSWTLERDAACLIALQYEDAFRRGGPPIVVRKVIPRASILYYDPPAQDGQALTELVIAPMPGGAVDGCEAEWREAACHRRVYLAEWRA